MKKISMFISGVLLTTLAMASSTENFINGLKHDLLLTRTSRALELSDHVYIAPFGLLGQIFSPDAIATYNGKLNTINLAENHLEMKRGRYQIKDARTIRGPKIMYTYLSTIFHEMGHAELDVFIENEHDLDDVVLMYHYKNQLKPYYKKITNQNPHTVFHEHFGYYRTEIIDFMYDELSNIFLYNGYNRMKNSCFLTQNLRKSLKDGMSLEKFTEFMTSSKKDEFYRHKIGPQYVFVRGKDIDLTKGPNAKSILNQTHLLFWGYHQTFYGFPMNEKDFVTRLNNSHYRKNLAKCRTELWHNYHSR